MGKIIEASELPEQEKLYFKKDIFGYRIVHPNTNPDGSMNWTNILFGGWRNLSFLVIALLVLGFILYSYTHDVSQFRDIAADPCSYCPLLKGVGTGQFVSNITLP